MLKEKLDPDHFLRLNKVIESLEAKPGQCFFFRRIQPEGSEENRRNPIREIVYIHEIITGCISEEPIDPMIGMVKNNMIHFDSAADRFGLSDLFMMDFHEHVRRFTWKNRTKTVHYNTSQSAADVRQHLRDGIRDIFGDTPSIWQRFTVFGIPKRKNRRFNSFVAEYKRVHLQLGDFKFSIGGLKYKVFDNLRGGSWWMLDLDWDKLGKDTSAQQQYRLEAAEYVYAEREEQAKAEIRRKAKAQLYGISRKLKADQDYERERQRRRDSEAEWEAMVARDKELAKKQRKAVVAKKPLCQFRLSEERAALYEQARKQTEENIAAREAAELELEHHDEQARKEKLENDLAKAPLYTAIDFYDQLLRQVSDREKLTMELPIWRKYRLWKIDPIVGIEDEEDDFWLWINRYRRQYLVRSEPVDDYVHVVDRRTGESWKMTLSESNKL